MTDTSSCDQHVDIAIVGAGAAGVFAAWRLSERYPDKSIQLYESNSRIGGKLYTIPIPGIEDFVADLGAMRFYKEWHPLLFQAINELGLEVVNFTTPKESELFNIISQIALIHISLISFIPVIG